MSDRTLTQTKTTAPTFAPVNSGVLQRKCACGNHTVAGVECAECAKNKSGLQRKLAIGASHDPLEREADRVADQVLATPAHSAVSGSPLHIQRYTGRTTKGMDTAPSSVDRVLASSGRPLEPVLQQDMGQRFGHDFSQVRVHTGGAAEQSARDVNANAYTMGHNIVFGTGQFAPGTHDGQRLIAHELTHVVQQSGADGIRVGQSNEKRGLSPIFHPGSAAGDVILRRQVADSDGETKKAGTTRIQRPLTRPCDAWEYNPLDFSREIAKQYVQQEFPPYLTVAIASVDCGDGGDECLIYFDIPRGFHVHVMLDHKPVYVSATRIDPVPGRRPFCDYSYECKRSGELLLKRLRCSEPGSPIIPESPSPLPSPPSPFQPPKPGPGSPAESPVEVTIKATVESEESKEKGEKKQEESRKISVEVVIPIPKLELGKAPVLRAPIVLFGKFNLEVAGGAKSETPDKPGEAIKPQAYGEFKPSVPIVRIEKERIPLPLRPTIGFDLSAVGAVELKKKGGSLEGGGEANLELKVPFSGTPLFFFGKGTGSYICSAEAREDSKCLFKWGVGAGVGATFGGEPKK